VLVESDKSPWDSCAQGGCFATVQPVRGERMERVNHGRTEIPVAQMVYWGPILSGGLVHLLFFTRGADLKVTWLRDGRDMAKVHKAVQSGTLMGPLCGDPHSVAPP
jgi:hypothetical protein